MRSRITMAAAGIFLAVGFGGCSVLTELGSSQQLQPSANQPGPTSAQVVRVIDGDTIAVAPTSELPATNSAGSEHVVRLLGIDAPEMNKSSGNSPDCGAQEATDRLGQLIAGASVTLTFDASSDHTDRYGRSLAYVETPGAPSVDIALQMVIDGYAGAWYPRSEPEPERFASYADALRAAEVSGVGAHGSCGVLGRDQG